MTEIQVLRHVYVCDKIRYTVNVLFYDRDIGIETSLLQL